MKECPMMNALPLEEAELPGRLINSRWIQRGSIGMKNN
jgi:hypothetical protein